MTSVQRYRIDEDLEDRQTELVRDLLDTHGWQQTHGDDWAFYWSDLVLEADRFKPLTPSRRINQFPGMSHLGLKDELFHTLDRAAERTRRAGITSVYDFIPRAYSMPDEYDDWRADAEENPQKLWIQKPKAWALGEGIELVHDPDEVETGEDWLIQEYIANPLLLPDEPCKHTLRIYVAVTSLDPLDFHIYSSGLAKFTSRPYTADRASLQDRVIHLTNPTIQLLNKDVEKPVRAIDLAAYRRKLQEADIDDDALWLWIRRVLTQTFIAAREPILAEARRTTPHVDRCFQFLGCDLLIDDQLKPWLIECNMGPDLGMRAPKGTADHIAQRRAKGGMVAAFLELAGVIPEPTDENAPRFDPLFPAPDTNDLCPCLALPRPSDRLRNPGAPMPVLQTRDVTSKVDDDQVVLKDAKGRVLRLNPTATYFWLRHEEGAGPEEIAKEIAALHPSSPDVERDVWDCFGNWVEDGLLDPRWPKGL